MKTYTHMHKATHLHMNINILPIREHTHTPHFMSWPSEVQESYRFFHLIRRHHYWLGPLSPDWDVPPQTSFKTHYTHQGTEGLSTSAGLTKKVLLSYVIKAFIYIIFFILYSDLKTVQLDEEVGSQRRHELSAWIIHIIVLHSVQFRFRCATLNRWSVLVFSVRIRE